MDNPFQGVWTGTNHRGEEVTGVCSSYSYFPYDVNREDKEVYLIILSKNEREHWIADSIPLSRCIHSGEQSPKGTSMKKQKPPKFKEGDKVDYYRRGLYYGGVVKQDRGIMRGAGRIYRITPPEDGQHDLDWWVFDVAERFLTTSEA
jgi:hypothetical protein